MHAGKPFLIIPETVHSAVKDSITQHLKATGWFDIEEEVTGELALAEDEPEYHTVEDLKLEVSELEKKMRAAAEALEFEKAAARRLFLLGAWPRPKRPGSSAVRN